jgi:hypothetical protein
MTVKREGVNEDAAGADAVVVIDPTDTSDPEANRMAELRNIAHDLRGSAWSTEGLLRLLHDDWYARSDDERRRILKLALAQAGALQALPPRLEQVYRTPPVAGVPG